MQMRSGQLRQILDEAISTHIPEPDKMVYQLALGRHGVSPFPQEMIDSCRSKWFSLLGNGPWDTITEHQPFFLLAVGETLRRQGDPDAMIFSDVVNGFPNGVFVGMGEKMPRTPTAFSRKVKWRTLDDCEFQAQVDNYRLTAGLEEIIEDQFKEKALGMVYSVPALNAESLFPPGRFRVSAQGALEKADGSWRILHDGTHGTRINNGIRSATGLAGHAWAGRCQGADGLLPGEFRRGPFWPSG